jgi:EamA domain-containing membrane protein RarD
MCIRIKQVKSVATVLYMLGFVSSIITMFLAEIMNSNDLHMIEHCLFIFIIGAVTLCACDLYESWLRG